MRRRRSIGLAVVLGCLAAVVLVVASVSSAGDPFVLRHPVYGGVEATFGGCPDDGAELPAGTVCTDNYIIVWRGYAVEKGSVAPSKAPVMAYAETVRLEFTGAGEPNVTFLRQGFTDANVDLSIDVQQLSTASVSVAIPMDDGSTFAFTGRWTPWSERFVFGNNGTAAVLPRHFVDRCHTVVSLAHQKYRKSLMAGTLDGAPVHSYESFWSGSIFNNSFRLIDVPHGGGACG